MESIQELFNRVRKHFGETQAQLNALLATMEVQPGQYRADELQACLTSSGSHDHMTESLTSLETSWRAVSSNEGMDQAIREALLALIEQSNAQRKVIATIRRRSR